MHVSILETHDSIVTGVVCWNRNSILKKKITTAATNKQTNEQENIYIHKHKLTDAYNITIIMYYHQYVGQSQKVHGFWECCCRIDKSKWLFRNGRKSDESQSDSIFRIGWTNSRSNNGKSYKNWTSYSQLLPCS